MPIAKLEYNLPEENEEFKTAVNAGTLSCVCHNISRYVRELYKYEEREMLPKEEVEQKLRELLADYYELDGV
jgi:hypothetical protein